jgi:hypothetical protein
MNAPKFIFLGFTAQGTTRLIHWNIWEIMEFNVFVWHLVMLIAAAR